MVILLVGLFVTGLIGVVQLCVYLYRYLNPKKIVYILRGVPGVGKDTWAENREEENSNENYEICSNDDLFWNNNDEWVFDHRRVHESTHACMESFLDNIKKNVPVIYVSNVNNQYWQFTNYVTIAEMAGYEVQIVTFRCRNVGELEYFHSRNEHNTPLAFCRKVFNNWELYEVDLVIEPHTENFPGDCLPFPKVIEKELDNQLDEYWEKASQEVCVNSLSSSDEYTSDFETSSVASTASLPENINNWVGVQADEVREVIHVDNPAHRYNLRKRKNE
jgi:hypothetical protein